MVIIVRKEHTMFAFTLVLAVLLACVAVPFMM